MDVLAGKIARYIRSNHPNPASEAVLLYSLIHVLNNTLTIVIVLTATLITGEFWNSLITLFLFAFLRMFSGGVHLQSSTLCSVISAIVIAFVAMSDYAFWPIGAALTTVALILVLIYAPSGLNGYGNLKEKYYPLLKIAAAVIISSNFLIQSPLFSSVFFAQTLTIIPWMFRVVYFLEGRKTDET